MRKILITFFVLFLVSPSLAVFTDNFESNPFGLTGDWSAAGDVVWTGYGPGNDFVALGSRLISNDDSILWQSFTVAETGQYGVSFDYRFVGVDWAYSNDRVTVKLGSGDEDFYDVFSASSNSGLTGGLLFPGDWQNVTTPSEGVVLKADQNYWLSFRLKEASGWWTPVTSLYLDNISLDLIPGVLAVPAPGAILLGGIGIIVVGWFRKKQMM